MEFCPSPGFTVGLELEFQLLDPASWDLVDGILPLLDTYPAQQAVKPEFIQNTVELVSPPAAGLGELEASLRPLLRELLAHCDRLGMGLCGAGTHPFYRRSALVTPGRRYAAMEQASGWLGHNQVTFATHVHLGLPDGEEAVTLMRELKPFLPLLIALSASSPFWHGADTRFAAFRQRVLASARTYGTPPDFACWAEFERFFATMRRAGLLQALNDIHWDLRPRPDFGTLEVRVMDAQPTLARALDLVALVRALCRFLQHGRHDRALVPPLIPLPWWSQKDNGYAACRDGLEAQLITSADGDLQPLRAVAQRTFRLIEPFAAPDELPRLRRLAAALEADLPYRRQRQLHGASGSLPAVVRALAQELRADVEAGSA
ncbi:YbdK family carboxylate-amine ligase [Vulcanococcus limneticus]|uniref:carboxylate-amine ligase n=1 Tax=Vulcanococcus limneticus TaxID=2170428 RepID=UPI00398BF140